jgi:hypothetical protein
VRRIITKSLLLLVSQLCVNAQITTKQWTGSVDAEFSFGLVGYARDDSYKSVGVAASYGLLLNDHYIVGLGTKPNYVFSDGDYDGYFQPVYAEFKYQSIPNTNQFYYFGVARLGYSPISQKGMYAHIGVGFDYKKWNFGYGISYQFTRFKEDYSNEIYYNTYNMVFGTLSVGYRF